MSFTGTYKKNITETIVPVITIPIWNQKWVEYYMKTTGIQFIGDNHPPMRRINPQPYDGTRLISFIRDELQ